MMTEEPRDEPAEMEHSNSVNTTQEPKPSQTPEESLYQTQIELAKSDLSRRLDISVDEIKVLEARAVVWPDASLGCPQPGMVYVQAVQEGWLIRLQGGGEMYFYHSGGDEKPFLCEQTSGMVPKVTPNSDEMVPPPDSEID